MSEDPMTNQPTPNQPRPHPNMINHDGFEQEDLSSRTALYFLAGLVLVGVVVYLIVFGMYRFLDSYATAHQASMSPMVTPEADTRAVTPENAETFPQPRLEENERTQLRSFIDDQDRKLATYDWVDKDRGTVRIPIDRAMELIAQRGLPVHAEGASSAQSSAAQNSGTKKSETKTSAPVKKQNPKAAKTKAAASGK
jgi:hypothetical protein